MTSSMQIPDSRRAPQAGLGVVVIGRNEGDRLRNCLESVRAWSNALVYVDSGSTDGSVAMAQARGVAVVELDMRVPFTAARARNAGLKQLLQLHPQVDRVFFVDGDCEVVAGWLDAAMRFLDEHPGVAVVSGLRRERFPQKSVYNLLADIEWREYPFGEVRMCGGDALMRVDAVQKVNGYRPDLICGEEPELCFRLRRAGWGIWRLDAPMTLHDAAMYRFGQWWKRQVRTGFAYAQGAALHGLSAERYCIREVARVLFWAVGVPFLAVGLAVPGGWWGLAPLALYPLQILRLSRRRIGPARETWLRAVALTFCKFPELQGMLQYVRDRARGSQSGLIEYK